MGGFSSTAGHRKNGWPQSRSPASQTLSGENLGDSALIYSIRKGNRSHSSVLCRHLLSDHFARKNPNAPETIEGQLGWDIQCPMPSYSRCYRPTSYIRRFPTSGLEMSDIVAFLNRNKPATPRAAACKCIGTAHQGGCFFYAAAK